MSDYWAEEISEELPLFSSVNASCVIEKNTTPDEEEYSRKKEEILEALRAGDVTCVDIEARWHRGQAVIGDLRKRGHIIHTVRGAYRSEGKLGRAKRLIDTLEPYEAALVRDWATERLN